MRAATCLLICLCCFTRPTCQKRNVTCLVDIWRVKGPHEPVLAVGDGLALPDRETGELRLSQGEHVLAACTGFGNVLKVDRRQHVEATCSSSGTLQVLSDRVTPSELWCEERSLALARNTWRSCGPYDAFYLFEVGYNVSGRWLPVYSVCHDNMFSNTFYSHHQLLGSLLQYRRPQTPRPDFVQGCDSGYLFDGVSPDVAYAQESVRSMLATTMSSRKMANDMLALSLLSRGHLAPSADFILNTHQHATFFYINAAPQWQIFNEGNWLSLESVLRNYAKRYSLDLLVWTGTSGVQSVNASDRMEEYLFLADNRKMAVPLFFWKLVQDKESGEALAFVGRNDPFVKGASTGKDLCPNVCEEAGWRRRKWLRPTKGRVVCCTPDALRAAVRGVPQLESPGLLPGPQRRRRRCLRSA